jgi:hypothetical protein
VPLKQRRKKKGGLKDAVIVEVDKISLNPVFVRCDFAKQAAKLMSVKGNPEKQLRVVDPNCGKFIKTTRHCLYIEQGKGALVTDIGRRWMEKSRLYTKKTGFTRWEVR